MTQEEAEWHTKFGLKSGFPPCCVDFYVKEYRPSSDNSPRLYMNYHNFKKMMYLSLGLEPFGYIPCPTCLLNKNFVNVIQCDPDSVYPENRTAQKYLYSGNVDGFLTDYYEN